MMADNPHLLSRAIGTMFERDPGDAGVERMLRAVRRHLSMDVAFVARFAGADRVMRHVDADGDPVLRPGMRMPLDEGFCRHVVEGRLPGVIPDIGAVPLARDIAAAIAMPVGAHLGVPIRMSDGSLYGTLCCFSRQPDPSLGQRDLQFLNVFADLLADRLESDMAAGRLRDEKRARIEQIFRHDELTVVYQPIYRLQDGGVAGVECLSRFTGRFHPTPDRWFADAADIGLGPKLEALAIRRALAGMDALPQQVYLSVNGSPQLFTSPELAWALEGADPRRVVLEVTEHATVSDYRPLWNSLAAWRKRGMRVAIDDAGAGYASMRHILDLEPDYIKLDISLVRDIDTDARRRALAAALIAFAREIGSMVTAEGVETEAELQALRKLRVDKVQGFHLSRPVPLDEAVRLAAAAVRPACAAAGG